LVRSTARGYPPRLTSVGLGGQLLLDELDRLDLVLLRSTRRRHGDGVPLAAADERARDGARHGDLPALQVRLELADEPVLHDVAALGLLERHGRPEDHAVAAGVLRDVDHLGARDPVLDLEDAALDVRLLVLGRVVLGVLGEVAVRARLGDLLHDLRTLDRLEALQLLLQPDETALGHRDAIAHLSTPFILSLPKDVHPEPCRRAFALKLVEGPKKRGRPAREARAAASSQLTRAGEAFVSTPGPRI
jgi:hypothetical protein